MLMGFWSTRLSLFKTNSGTGGAQCAVQVLLTDWFDRDFMVVAELREEDQT
jgi:hypothetical protein